jgi:hypothetical protein
MEIYNRAMSQSPESATEWLLKLIVWEFFCTLTWESRARSCGRKRQTHVTRWLRHWARTVRPGMADPLGHLAFVFRWERGEIGGRPHCHILISRFPERSITPSTCFAMINTWKHGIAQVRLYDPYGPGDVFRYMNKGVSRQRQIARARIHTSCASSTGQTGFTLVQAPGRKCDTLGR